MKEIPIGISFDRELTVTADQLASVAGSGTLEVFATPRMIANMELASLFCVMPYMEGDETTVGTMVNVEHTAPCSVGDKVYFRSTLKAVDRRKLTFEVTARTDKTEIGCGTHERFVVNAEKFMSKI